MKKITRKVSVVAAARVVETDDPVAYFIGHAHALTTQKSYASAVRMYHEYWQERIIPGEVYSQTITTERARQWLAVRAAEHGVSAVTIKAYRSALGTEYTKVSATSNTDSDSNPLHCATIDMVIDGITKSQAKSAKRESYAEATAKSAAGDNVITAAHIERLRVAWSGTTEEHELYLAAAAIGTAGMFRPNELHGSQVYPERALKMGQVSFRDGETTITLQRMHGEARDIDPSTLASPTAVVITLFDTKTSLGKSSFTTITDATAVDAMWKWMNRRRRHTKDGCVFQRDGWSRLTPKVLTQKINAELQRQNLDVASTPKAARRGGASDRCAAGDTIASTNAAGRWAPNSRVSMAVYASAAARRTRSAGQPGVRT